MSRFPFLLLFFIILFSCSNNEDSCTNSQVMVETNAYLDTAVADSKLSDVDFISLQPAIYNNTLRVQLNYIHKEDDSIIEWAGDEITCLYTTYETDYLGSSKKISEILNGKKILKKFNQAFYIDTDRFEIGNYYFIECTINTGYISLSSYGTFLCDKNL